MNALAWQVGHLSRLRVACSRLRFVGLRRPEPWAGEAMIDYGPAEPRNTAAFDSTTGSCAVVHAMFARCTLRHY